MFAEAMDMDEAFVKVRITAADAQRGPQHVASLLDQIIFKYAH